MYIQRWNLTKPSAVSQSIVVTIDWKWYDKTFVTWDAVMSIFLPCLWFLLYDAMFWSTLESVVTRGFIQLDNQRHMFPRYFCSSKCNS